MHQRAAGSRAREEGGIFGAQRRGQGPLNPPVRFDPCASSSGGGIFGGGAYAAEADGYQQAMPPAPTRSTGQRWNPCVSSADGGIFGGGAYAELAAHERQEEDFLLRLQEAEARDAATQAPAGMRPRARGALGEADAAQREREERGAAQARATSAHRASTDAAERAPALPAVRWPTSKDVQDQRMAEQAAVLERAALRRQVPARQEMGQRAPMPPAQGQRHQLPSDPHGYGQHQWQLPQQRPHQASRRVDAPFAIGGEWDVPKRPASVVNAEVERPVLIGGVLRRPVSGNNLRTIEQPAGQVYALQRENAGQGPGWSGKGRRGVAQEQQRMLRDSGGVGALLGS